MGGFGSGNRWQGGRRTTAGTLALCINRLRQMGLLDITGQSNVTWDNGSSVTLRIEPFQIDINYTLDKSSAQAKSVSQTVMLTRTQQHLGGNRTWFRCPRCSRRCGKLHLCGDHFMCRRCGNLGYASQVESRSDRGFARVERIRSTLGWCPGFANGHEGKPRYMRWAKYERLINEHDALVERICGRFMRMLRRT